MQKAVFCMEQAGLFWSGNADVFMKHNLTLLPAPSCDLLFHRTETSHITLFSSSLAASWEHLQQPFFTFPIMPPQ